MFHGKELSHLHELETPGSALGRPSARWTPENLGLTFPLLIAPDAGGLPTRSASTQESSQNMNMTKRPNVGSATALTREVASLRAGVRRVVLALANISEIDNSERRIETKAALEAIGRLTKKARGTFDMERDFDLVCRLACRIRMAHLNKGERLLALRARTIGQAAAQSSARADLAVLLSKPFAKRLDLLRRNTLEKAARSTLRYGDAPSSALWIHFVEPGRPVNYSVRRVRAWGRYGNCYPAWDDRHNITVERTWLSTVRGVGAASVNGCLILAARPEVARDDDGRAIYRAVVATQSRGFSVNVEVRWICAWGFGVLTQHKSLQSALRENPPEALDILRREAAAHELDKLSYEDLDALKGLAA